jgi:hypothetical protein
MCGLHHTRGDVEHEFLGWASKLGSTVCQWFDLKIIGTIFSGLASKPVTTVPLGLASKLVVNGCSQFGLKIGGNGFSQIGLKIGGGGFFWLGSQNRQLGLVIYASKSPRQFLGLGLKTKRAIICWLRHKTDWKMKTAQGTRWDLAACFTWKQVGLGFFSLASRLVEARRGWCMWHNNRDCVDVKLKMDGSIRRVTSDPATLTLLFLLY